MVRYTTYDSGHKHAWSPNAKRTSVNDGHSHVISLKSRIARKGNTGHTHRLLMKVRKVDTNVGY